jgi:shikimate dehydrogenase
MKLYSLFGNPVAHSLSPRMHNLAFLRLGIRGAYIRTLLEEGSALRATFESLRLDGANVTVPHKQHAFKACDYVQGIGARIGAVNTLVKQGDTLVGHNTDAPGFMRTIETLPPPSSALILGAGGTARAIAFALKEANVDVVLLNRSAPNLAPFIAQGFECYTHASFTPRSFDLIINTTSAGLHADELPLASSILKAVFQNATSAFDVIYNKQTPFLALAQHHGLTCKDGKEMLLWQGVLAFNLFHDNRLQEAKIAEAMQEALRLSS